MFSMHYRLHQRHKLGTLSLEYLMKAKSAFAQGWWDVKYIVGLVDIVTLAFHALSYKYEPWSRWIRRGCGVSIGARARC